ncbi:MAG: hypothetical protein KME27_15220 [Lyngbya sp. HA4199-MV5]|nr:hypothetical protein [Lyngbya sp. HA4199-MV5]
MLEKLLRAAAITVLLGILMHEGGGIAYPPRNDQPLPQASLPLQWR